jgi:hypothetical protein
MAKTLEDGRVWGRPEALDTLGRPPGRRRRFLGSLLGVAAIAAGAYLGLTGTANGFGLFTPPPPPPPPVAETCASLGVTLQPGHFPPEGIAPQKVVQLSRVDGDGTGKVIAPKALVLAVTSGTGGSLRMSVLMRTEMDGVTAASQVSSADRDQALVAAILYDIKPDRALTACRTGK